MKPRLKIFRRFGVPILGELESGRSNNLNLIRFVLASSVVLSHSFVLLKMYDFEPMRRYFHFSDLGGIAVFGFFFASGYLITQSGMSSASPTDYLFGRVLRIFPALIVSVLFCVCVIGPICTNLPLPDYFRSPDTKSFLTEMWMHPNPNALAGVFENSAYRPVVNAPLWTLPAEWAMYIAVLGITFLWRVVMQKQKIGKADISVVLIAILLTYQMRPFTRHALPWILFFFMGMLAYATRRRIRLDLLGAALGLGLVLILLKFAPFAGKALFPFALSYAILVFAFHPAIYFAPYTRFGDYSYGMYIYAWPLQQILARRISQPLVLFTASFAATIILAAISWHLLERRCLRMRKEIQVRLRLAPVHRAVEQALVSPASGD